MRVRSRPCWFAVGLCLGVLASAGLVIPDGGLIVHLHAGGGRPHVHPGLSEGLSRLFQVDSHNSERLPFASNRDTVEELTGTPSSWTGQRNALGCWLVTKEHPPGPHVHLLLSLIGESPLQFGWRGPLLRVLGGWSMAAERAARPPYVAYAASRAPPWFAYT